MVIIGGIICLVLILLVAPQMSAKQNGQVLLGFIGIVCLLAALASFGLPLVGLIIVVLILKSVFFKNS